MRQWLHQAREDYDTRFGQLVESFRLRLLPLLNCGHDSELQRRLSSSDVVHTVPTAIRKSMLQQGRKLMGREQSFSSDDEPASDRSEPESALAPDLARYDDALFKGQPLTNTASIDPTLASTLRLLHDAQRPSCDGYPCVASSSDEQNGVSPSGSDQNSSGDHPTISLADADGTITHPGNPVRFPGLPPRFECLSLLGRGGFGSVFLAKDHLLKRRVAIKVPHSNVVHSQCLRTRFFRESRALARLNHPNIVRVLDAGGDDETLWQVMEYVEGQSLKGTLQTLNESVAPTAAARMVALLADGVQHAHDAGVLHRDIKPDNILMEPIDASTTHSSLDTLFPRLTDFGLARVVDDAVEMSRAGELIGTPNYMAPEQLAGCAQQIDGRTDVYQLGVVLHELLLSHVPFPEATSLTARTTATVLPVPRLRTQRSEISKDLETICLKCLQFESAHRYATAGELRDDLRCFLEGRPTQARPMPWYERLQLWSRRNRRVAMLLTVCCLLVFSLMVFGALHLHQLSTLNTKLLATSAERTRQAALAIEHRQRADELAARAIQESQRSSNLAWLAEQREHSALLLQAGDSWERGLLKSMGGTLLQARRKEDAVPDFVWRYLWGQGTSQRPFAGHRSGIICAAVSGDGATSWTIGADAIRKWDSQSGLPLAVRSVPQEGTEMRAAISSDVARAVISLKFPDQSIDEVYVQDLDSGEILMSKSYGFFNVNAVSISDDGRLVSVAGSHAIDTERQAFVELWDVAVKAIAVDETNYLQSKFGQVTVPTHAAIAVQISPDLQEIWVGKRIQTSTALDYELVRTPFVHSGASGHLASQWSLGPPTPIESPQDGQPEFIAFSNDAQHVAISFHSPDWVGVWRRDSGKLVRATESLSRRVDSISFDHNSSKLLIGTSTPGLKAGENPATPGDLTVTESRPALQQWDFLLDTVKELPFPADRRFQILHPVPSSTGENGSESWIVGESGGAVTRWSMQPLKAHQTFRGHQPKEAWGLAIAADGESVFSVGDDHAIRQLNLSSGKEMQVSARRSILVSCVALSPDGKLLAAGGYDDDVVIHDTETLKVVSTLHGHTHDVRTVAFSADGKTLATGGRDRMIRLWDLHTFKEIRKLTEHRNNVRSILWANDGRFFSSDSDGKVIVWDKDANPIQFRQETQGVHCMAFIPGGTKLPTAMEHQGTPIRDITDSNSDSTLRENTELMTIGQCEMIAMGESHGTIRFWHLPTNSIWLEIEHAGVEIRTLAFSPDGQTLAIGASDQAIHLWHVATGRRTLTFSNLGAAVNQLAFTADGRRLAAAMHDGTIRIWDAQVP
jgi:serine/threonine protein kinase/WD40 repeat protein